MRKEIPSLNIIVPCYNEAEIFSFCLNELKKILVDLIEKGFITKNSKLIFIDDGSSDNTWAKICKSCEDYKFVKGIKLSRNRGHQIALIAGLSISNADITISIDADLQDDINCIYSMIEEYMNGFDIVYGVRKDRFSDSFFKRFSAKLFYKLMGKLGVDQIENHADFRLLSYKAVKSLLQFKEKNLYIRGIIPLLGYKSTKVYYDRSKRILGESKYPLKKMISLGLEGITSMSITPLRLVSLLGFFISIISSLMIFYSLFSYFYGDTISGWVSIIIVISFLGGAQILCLGIIGEYIGKIYLESKERPNFFIEENIGDE